MEPFGISVALLTPFTEYGAINANEIGAHARRVVDRGAAGVTLFGTTGEGASLDLEDRKTAIEAVLATGLPAEKVVLGISETSVGGAAARVAEGLAYGIDRFLILPPFYFKGCNDAGLFSWHQQVLAQTDPRARFILYHIPQVSSVPLSVSLVGQLAAADPARIIAIKDSSGSWENTEALLKQGALSVLVGDERQLHRAAALGGAGSICGVANIYPERVVRLFETATEDPALSADVTEIVSVPIIPALKAILSVQQGAPGWERVRAPLTLLTQDQRSQFLATVMGEA